MGTRTGERTAVTAPVAADSRTGPWYRRIDWSSTFWVVLLLIPLFYVIQKDIPLPFKIVGVTGLLSFACVYAWAVSTMTIWLDLPEGAGVLDQLRPATSRLVLLALTAVAYGKDITLSNDPVQITLPVNREIRIEFPEAVIDLNVPAAVGERLQTLLKPNGALFWKATGQISNSRAIATTAAGDVILLDLHTAPSAKDDELVYRLLTPAMTQVVQAQNATPAQAARQAGLPDFLVGELLGGNGMDSGGGVTLTDAASQYDYTDMAAFAMQHYLGPARLISNLPATKVKNGFIGKHLLRVWQGKVQLKVLDSWLYQGQYITAVQARNTGIDPVTFDPRAIRGNFRFVATLHETLQPRGHQEDTTIWVFISDVPFNQASGGR